MLYVVTKCCTTITSTILSINVCTELMDCPPVSLALHCLTVPILKNGGAPIFPFLSFPINPLCLLIDICLYYQTEHSTHNTVHSFILYNSFRPFVSAIFRKNGNNVN